MLLGPRQVLLATSGGSVSLKEQSISGGSRVDIGCVYIEKVASLNGI